MNSDANDPTGRRTSEKPGNSGVTGSAIDPSESDLEDDDVNEEELENDELGVPATQATGGLVPDGAEDDQP